MKTRGRRQRVITNEHSALRTKSYKKVTLENVGIEGREMLTARFGTPDRCEAILYLVNKNFDRVGTDQYGIKRETIYAKRNKELIAIGQTTKGRLFSLKELINSNGVITSGEKSLRCFIGLPIEMLLWAGTKTVNSVIREQVEDAATYENIGEENRDRLLRRWDTREGCENMLDAINEVFEVVGTDEYRPKSHYNDNSTYSLADIDDNSGIYIRSKNKATRIMLEINNEQVITTITI